ncbi:MAG TPA: DUF5683 domain-containing protein [Niastella sp.]
MKKVFFAIALILIIPMLALSQQKDTLIVKDSTGKVIASSKVHKRGILGSWKDSTGKRSFEPRKAAIYSAILPGLGQFYNKKYWKVPIAWAAVGIPIYTYFDNKLFYNRIRYALTVIDIGAGNPGYDDALAEVHSSLLSLVKNQQSASLLSYRNEFRKNMDYSILFTLLFWGLNVVDATVDAHLKGFNVNDNLSMHIKPALISNQAIGVSILFNFTDNRTKAIP